MKSVKKLPPEVCSVIRSGVIVPTPTQGVVELVLNSIDANATSIAIRIDLKLFKLQVIDNGYGITFPDLETIGSRSVTSKCYSLKEYYNNLMYHGYRGEALASMCEMSGCMEIVTRSTEDDVTYKKLFLYGKAQSTKVSDLKRPTCGTTVTITDFMYNMQVRRSRLKEPLELEAIRTQIECIALAHPEVSFSLRNDNKGRVIMEKHKSSDMLNAFEHLFGHTLSRTLSIINFSSSKFKINGFISKESYRHNDLQFIYVNKKPIIKSKLHKFVCALLAKSSIIRCNGTWKNKPIPKHIPSERWLSFPSLEKVKKFPVFVMNVTCARNEYEICWDSRKPSIYFKDWDGILACVSEGIQTFLKTENLVDEEDIQEDQEGRIADDKKCGDNYFLLPKNDPLTSEQKVETWNMQGAVHGITAKRIKRSKQNKNLLMENSTNHNTTSLKQYSVTPSSSNSMNDIDFYDTINSVPPVVKFLAKIETPELLRLKITRGAYHLKMMEDENKKQKIANKLGKFKFACKPKLCNSIANNKINKKKTLLSSKASDYTHGNNTINLDKKLVKNTVELKTVDKHDKETITHINNATDTSCMRDMLIDSSSSAVLVDKNKIYHTSELKPQFPHITLNLSPEEDTEDFITSDHNSVFSGRTYHSHLAACYDNDSKKVKSKNISCFKFSRNRNKDIDVLSHCKPISIVEEKCNNYPEIYWEQNIPLNKDTRIKSSTHNNNSNDFKPDHSASPKINSKCRKLEISKTTLISIETPEINVTHKVDKTCITSPFFDKRTSLPNVHEVHVDNGECLKISDVSVRSSSLPAKNAPIGLTWFGDKEHSFHLEVPGNKDFDAGKHCSFKSSFNSLFEMLKGESSKESPVNKPECNLENYSSNVCNESLSNKNLFYASINHESKLLNIDQAPVCANTPRGCSVINEYDVNNVSESKQFFEIFENSILHTNSTTIKSSPYFSSKYKTKHTFDCFYSNNIEEENFINKTGTAELDSTSFLAKLKETQLAEELSLKRSNLTKVNLTNSHRDLDNLPCFESISCNLCSPKGIDKEKPCMLKNVNSLVDVTTLESSDLSPSTNITEDYIECKKMRLSEAKVESDIFPPTKNLNNFNTESEKIETEEIFDQRILLSPNGHQIGQTKVSANEVIGEVKDKTSLQNMDSTGEKMEVERNQRQYGKMDEEVMKDWQAFRNFEGKHFYVHAASGFTSFKSPDVAKQNTLYGMSKRFEFIPKGMSPILAAPSTLNHNFKSIIQYPNEQCLEWNSDTLYTEKVDLKTVKWRDKTDIMSNDISDLLDTAKANSEKKIVLNCSTIPDLSFMGAKMSRLLHEEKYDKCVFSNIQVIGQLDNKFIVTLFSPDKNVSPHVLGLFDQHAVHERIRLETLMKEYSEYEDKRMKFKAMKLNEPLKLELSSKELCIAGSFKNKFETLGLYFTVKEESIEFQKIPSCLHARYLRERSMQWLKTAIRNVIQDVVLDLINSGGLDPIPPEVFRDVINSEACKGAVKFGDPLSLEQCEELLFYLSLCDLPFFCAHGRPSFMPLFDLRSFESERKVYISK